MKLSRLIHADSLFGSFTHALDRQRTADTPLPLIVNGLSGGGQEAFCCEATLHCRREGGVPSLFLAPDDTAAEALTQRLTQSGVRCLHFPCRALIFYEYSASHDTERERLFALHALARGEVDAIVATPAAAVGFLPSPARFAEWATEVKPGQEVSPDLLCRRLSDMGYVRTDAVEAPGQFARRGFILDLWCRESESPLRLEFFGDEIDRLTSFDPMTQRSLDPVSSFTLLPAHEVVPDEQAKKRLLAAMDRASGRADSQGQDELSSLCSQLRAGISLACRDRYLSLIYPERATLLDYLPHGAPVYLLGTNETAASLKGALEAQQEAAAPLVSRGLLDARDAKWGLDAAEYQAALAARPTVHINAFTGGTFGREGGVFGFRMRRLPAYGGAPKAFVDDLAVLLKEQYTLFAVCDTASAAASTLSYLSDLGIPCAAAKEDLTHENAHAGVVYVTEGALSSGFDLIGARVAVLSLSQQEASAVRRPLRRTKKPKYTPGQTILSYAELSPGDHVVHEKYGIGLFEGLESITQNGVTRDYITIRYAGTDKLFVPADQLSAVTRYIGGGEGTSVKLSRMGGAAWEKAKSRAKGAAREMAQELLTLYAERARKPGFSFPSAGEMEEEFASGFEYELTPCQEGAVLDILADMEKSTPMDRLLCGDVGFGKTEVALRAAFRAIANGYQVALLVPTTILAMQHYQTALARLRGFAVQVDVLSRFRTQKEQRASLRRLERGETDLIVGTHALLGDRVKFKRLGLLIIDEEQRFGVAQKEKIKALGSNIDVLTLTATPIPRTLNMAMSGIRDMSVLGEAPGERRPVSTYVLEYNRDIVNTAIRRELARMGQVLYLYNRTEEIDLVAGRLQADFPAARVAYAHGQMEREQIEDTWQALVQGEIDILVCTTIVESGVDLPNANTLIVEGADRMGLSQMHQLRGRTGRSSRQAYAYFTYRQGKALSDIARRRLSAIREYAEFGAGFRVALRDLEIRGAGDLLGASQHGHIESVGYDLYIRLLESAVLEEKGEVPPAPFSSTVDLRLDANIPAYYISSPAQRIEVYQKIVCIAREADREDVLDELIDRFGTPPKPVRRLLHIALTRATAERCRISLVERVNGQLRLYPTVTDLALWAEVYTAYPTLRTLSARTPYLSLPLREGEDAAEVAARLLLAYEAAQEKLTKETPHDTV